MPAEVIVLGFDTATPATAVALRLPGGRTRERRDDPAPGGHPGHATRLLGLARELLEHEGLGWGAIERVAAGTGPGTFTGLRVGIATARGLAQSLGCELSGVPTLAALAHAALGGEDASARGEPAEGVLAVLDARRGEAFAAAYAPAGQPWPAELAPARALAPARLGEVLGQARLGGGEGIERWLAVGDGAVRFREALAGLGVSVPGADSQLHRVSAAAICALAERGAPAAGVEALVPEYGRRPDAELALEGAAGGAGHG